MLSRRNFIRNVAFGTTGAAFTLGRVPRGMAAGKEVGIITLDAIFLVYIPAIPTSVQGQTHSSFAFGKNFSITLSLSLPQNPDIALTAVVPPGEEDLFASDVSQFQSMAVSGAMLLRTDFNRRLPNGEVDSVSIGAGSDTGFYGLFRPKLRLAGRPGKLRYRIAEASGVIVAGLSRLQTQDGFSQQTADSLRALYVTDPSNLAPPRFALSEILSSGVGAELNEASNVDSGVNATASTIATVIDQTGFQSESLIQAFAPGSPVQITYSSAQEFPSKSIATFTLGPGDTDQPIKIYQDLALKTWVVIPVV